MSTRIKENLLERAAEYNKRKLRTTSQIFAYGRRFGYRQEQRQLLSRFLSEATKEESITVVFSSTNCLSGQRVFVDLTFLVLFVSRQKEHGSKLEAIKPNDKREKA